MNELKEIRVNDQRLLLNDNLVKSSILPRISSELERDVVIQGNTIIEGAVFARYFEIQQGNLEVKGAVFTQMELHVNTDAKGTAKFEKAVGSVDSIVALAPGFRIIFQADINAKQVKLRNAFVAGSIFADEIVLEDCIVIGGVFAAHQLELNNSIVGTFNSSVVRVSKTLHLLLPSAFSVEKINFIPGSEIYNLSLADLGSLFKGVEQSKNSGKMRMSLDADEIKSVLRSETTQQVIRSYSVIGKVLAADLLDIDKFNNHFLLTASALGSQLLKTYDLGSEKTLTVEKISDFFFDILHGKISVQNMEGNFSLSDIVDTFKVTKEPPIDNRSSNVPVDAHSQPQDSSNTAAEATTEKNESVEDISNTQNTEEVRTEDAPLIVTDSEVQPDSTLVAEENQEQTTCTNCGSANKADDVFCQNCGHSIIAVTDSNQEELTEESGLTAISELKCSKCGNSHTEEDVFCMNCGNKLK